MFLVDISGDELSYRGILFEVFEDHVLFLVIKKHDMQVVRLLKAVEWSHSQRL
jgi:hypothetical protein